MVNIRVEKREGAIAWRQDIKKLEKDMRILVDDGCVALCFAGGNNIGEFRGGEVGLLNESGRIQKAHKNADFYFLVFNREKPSAVRWGVGKNPVSYQDRRLKGVMLSVTAFGHCDVMIHDAHKLWTQLPADITADDVVESSEIERFIQREVIAKVGPIISRKLNEVGDYTRIGEVREELGREITFGMAGLESAGIHLDKVVIEGMDFTDESKGIIEKAQAAAVGEIETDIVRKQAEQIRTIIEAVDGGKEDK